MSESRSESPADVDFSVIRTSIDMGHSMIDQILHGIHYGSTEVRGLLRDECDFILECKICKNLFRSFANFVAHKRVYCMESILDRETEDVFRNIETETVVVQPESPESKESATEAKTKETQGNINQNQKGGTTILDAVIQKTYKSNSKEYQLYTKVAERVEQTKATKVTNTVTLKSIPESSNAVTVEYADGDKSKEVEEMTSPRQDNERENGQQSVPKTSLIKKKSTITDVCANLLEKHSTADKSTNKGHLLEEILKLPLNRNRKSAPKKLNSSGSKTDEGNKTNLMETDVDVTELSGDSKQSTNTSKQKTPSPEKMDTSPSNTPTDNSWMKFCDMSHRRCIKCNKEYSSVDGLKYHARISHGDGAKLSKCPLCHKEFSYFSSVERHLRNVHNNTEQQITEFRKKMNVRNKFLERVSPDNTKAAEKKGKSLLNVSSWNRCKKCNKLFSKVKTYKNHIRFNCTPKAKSTSEISDVKEGENNTNVTVNEKKDCQSSNDQQHVYKERKLDQQSLLYKTLTSPSSKPPTVVYVYPKSPVQDKDYGKNTFNQISEKSSSILLKEKHKEVTNNDNSLPHEAAQSDKTSYSKDRRETRSVSSERHIKNQSEGHDTLPSVKSAFTKLSDSKVRVELKKLEDRLMTEATGSSQRTPNIGKGLPCNETRKKPLLTPQIDAHEIVKTKQTGVADKEKTPDKTNNRNVNSVLKSSVVGQNSESFGSISCPNSPSSVSSNSADGYSHKFKMTVQEMAELVESANLRKFARERKKHAHNILNRKSKKDGLGGKLVKPMKRNLRGHQILPRKVYSTRFSAGNEIAGIISNKIEKKDTSTEKTRGSNGGSNRQTHQLRSRDKVVKENRSKDVKKDSFQKKLTPEKIGNLSKVEGCEEINVASKQLAFDKADDKQDKKLSKELKLLQNSPGFNEQRYYDSSAKLRTPKEDVTGLEHSGKKIIKIERYKSNAKEVNRVNKYNEKRQSENDSTLRASKESEMELKDLNIDKAERGRSTMQEGDDETKTIQSKQRPKEKKNVQNSEEHSVKGYATIHSKSSEGESTDLHDSNARSSQSVHEKGKIIEIMAKKQNDEKAENLQVVTEMNSGQEGPGYYDLRHTPKAVSDIHSLEDPKTRDNDSNTDNNPSNLACEDLENNQVNDQLNNRQAKELRRLRNSSGFNERSYYTSLSRPGLSKEDAKVVQKDESQGKVNVVKQSSVTQKQHETEHEDDLQNKRLSKELKMLANSPGFNEKGYYISSRVSREDKQDGISSDYQTKESASVTRKALQENKTASNFLKQILLAAQKSVYNSKTIMNRKSPIKKLANLSTNISLGKPEEIDLLSQISEKKESRNSIPQKDTVTPSPRKEILKTPHTDQSKPGESSVTDNQNAADKITCAAESSSPETPGLDKSGTLPNEKGDTDTPSRSTTSEERNPGDSPPFIFLTKLADDVIVSYKMIDSVTTDVAQESTETLELPDNLSHLGNFENDFEVGNDKHSGSEKQEDVFRKKLEYKNVCEHKAYRTRLSTGSIVFNSDVLQGLEDDVEREEEWSVGSKRSYKSMTDKENQSITKRSQPDGSIEKHRDGEVEKIVHIAPIRKEDEKIENTVTNVNDVGGGIATDHIRDLNMKLSDTDKDVQRNMSGTRSSLTLNVHRTRLSTGSIFFDPEHFKTSPQKPDKGTDTKEIAKVRKTLTLLEKDMIAGPDKEGLQTTRKEPERFSLATGVKACEYCKRVFWKIRAYSEHVRRGKCGQYKRQKMKQKRSLSTSSESDVSQSPGTNVSQSPGSTVSQSPGSIVSQSSQSDVSQPFGIDYEGKSGRESEKNQHIVKRPRIVLGTEIKTVVRNENREERQDEIVPIQKEYKTTNNSDKKCIRNDGNSIETESTEETVVYLTDIKSEITDAVSETEMSKLPPNDTGKISDSFMLYQTEEMPASVPEPTGLSSIFTEDSEGESEFSGFSEADLKERELEVYGDIDNSFESEIIDVVGNDSDVEMEKLGNSENSNKSRNIEKSEISSKSMIKTRMKPKSNPWGQKRPYHTSFRSFVCDGKMSRKLVCQPMKKIDKMIDRVHLVCTYCNSKHTSMSNLRQHAIRHLGWKRYKCNICSCLKYNLSEVRLHLSRKHGIQSMDLTSTTLVTDLKRAARKIWISKRSNTLRDLREKGISTKSSPGTYAKPRPSLRPTTTKAGRSIKRKECEESSPKVPVAKKKSKSPQKSAGWRMIQLDEKRLSPLKKLMPPEGSDTSILSRARERLANVLNPSTSLPN